MNEGQLTRALAAGNAWWRDSQWERDDRDLRPPLFARRVIPCGDLVVLC